MKYAPITYQLLSIRGVKNERPLYLNNSDTAGAGDIGMALCYGSSPMSAITLLSRVG